MYERVCKEDQATQRRASKKKGKKRKEGERGRAREDGERMERSDGRFII